MEAHGLRIPHDISVIAVCSETTAKQQSLPLTAMVVQARTLGALAIERAAELLDVRTTASVELLAPQLTLGGSTSRSSAT